MKMVYINHVLEQLHLDTIKRRRSEIEAHRVKPIEGKKALEQAKKIINSYINNNGLNHSAD